MIEAAHRVLYLIICAAPPAQQTPHIAIALQQAG